MRPVSPIIAFCALVSVAFASYPVTPVPFTAVKLTGGFWQKKQEVNRSVTIPFALKQCEESGRLKNFELAAEVMRRRANGEPHFQIKPPTLFPFDDTDAYKAIEAASYSLSIRRDEALERKLDEWIAKIAAAQEPDGYLYTFRTMHPEGPGMSWVGYRRWELEPYLSHELYDAGHLYEAGVAHFRATGKRALLDVCLKNADLLWREFGGNRKAVAPGHQIVELALVKLYTVTDDERYLTLARKFLDARGPRGPEYNQQHKRVVDQDEAVGHAVRANYMYSGMADVAALTGDTRYSAAVEKIWANVVEKKFYLTGGVGALTRNEAYGGDYDLPEDAYNETCAAVAFMMWSHRMFLLTGEAKYMDGFERTAYNGFLSGVSVSGDRFCYPNPLAYDGKAKNNSGFAGRAPWFGCACCPPNLMRMLASLGGYFYAVRGDSIYVNLYGQSQAEVTLGEGTVKLSQETAYPWQGGIRLAVSPAHAREFTVRLRIPGWAQGRPLPSDLYSYEDPGSASWEVRVNGSPVAPSLDAKGYLAIDRTWKPGDVIEARFGMPVQRVHGIVLISSTRDQVAFERGPVVYCFEPGVDAPALRALAVPSGARLEPKFEKDFLGGVEVLGVSGAAWSGKPGEELDAIPYFSWGNQGLRAMKVWVRERPPE